MKRTRLFSYVVEHDTGHAPNPHSGFCTLCRCKFKKPKGTRRNIVELAETGDWIVGTGGANLKKSAGHHKLVYAMKVERKITRGEYFRGREFFCKKPSTRKRGDHASGDNLQPANRLENEQQYVLISQKRFYYFGDKAIRIPLDKFPNLEKKGPSFRSDFDDAYIERFEKWVTRNKRGKHGDPCKQSSLERRTAGQCKSSC